MANRLHEEESMQKQMAAWLALLSCGVAFGSQEAERTANLISRCSKRGDGLSVVVNAPDSKLIVALAEKSKFVVQSIHGDARVVDRDRHPLVIVFQPGLFHDCFSFAS